MNLVSNKRNGDNSLAIRAGVLIGLLLILISVPCWGKVLFLAHYDNHSAEADYAIGNAAAIPVYAFKVAGLTKSGRWGSGLDLHEPASHNCTYDAPENMDPIKGTVDFWYCIDEEGETYNPIFGWYDPPSQPGGKKKVSGFELYRYGASLIFAIYQPYAQISVPFDLDVGHWHHMEINWDCTGGDGKSEYNVYLDGKNVLRMTEAIAFKSGGGSLHLGIWDYGWGGISLRGRIDELRVTDQVEHLSTFSPPSNPYPTPGTIDAVAAAYVNGKLGLMELISGIDDLKHAAGLAGSAGETSEVTKAIKSLEVMAKSTPAALDLVSEKLQRSLGPAEGSMDNWLDRLKTLSSEKIEKLGPNLLLFQKKLDKVNDSIKDARGKAAQTTGKLYQHIPAAYNEAVVNFGYLKDELEGLKRASVYARKAADTGKTIDLAKQCDAAVTKTTGTLKEVSDSFYGMFADSEGAKKDPVAALPSFSANRAKSKKLQSILAALSKTANQIEEKRQAITSELQRLRSDPGFRKKFRKYKKYVPVALPPLEVAADGTMKRLIFGGTWGRTETMMSLGFDTLTETGASVKWVTKDKFETTESANTLRQWNKYQVPLSDTVFLYAVGDSMTRPLWFADVYNDNPEYYFRNTAGYVGGGGFDYRHPVPRALIVEYLEEAARINSQKPYTFIYKGPWEAHPCAGAGVSIPGKRTVSFMEHGFSEYAVKAFRKYLAEKYSSISKLNKAWRSSYKDFDAIEPPEPFIRAFVVSKDYRDQDLYNLFFPNKRLPGKSTTALTYEFERCRKDLYAEYLADCYQAIKRGDPSRPLASSTSGGIMDEILINSLDDLQMPEKCVDIWGKHPSGGYGWADSPYMYGLNRYFNKTLVAMEYYGWAQEIIGDDFYPTYVLAKGATAEGVYNSGRRDTWHEYSWGRKMLLFYWTQKMVELPAGFRAETSPLARPWASLFHVVKRRMLNLNDVLINTPIVKPRIGVVHPGVSIINAYPTNACGKITKDIFDRLISKQYHFGVVAEKFVLTGRDSLDNYDVIILPYAQYFADGFGEKLLAWVKDGGTLISAGPFGLYNKYGFEIEDGAAKVFGDLEFSYPTPDKYKLSWDWDVKRNGKKLSESYLVKDYGRGKVLFTSDGRGFGRAGSASTEAHVGIEIGATITGESSEVQKEKEPDDRARPLKLGSDKDLPAAVQAFYEVLEDSTKRKVWVESGNVEMVLRQKDSGGPLYVSMLNWDYYDGLETEVVVRGEYTSVTDLSIEGGFPIPLIIKDGLTRFHVIFGPGEGLMLDIR